MKLYQYVNLMQLYEKIKDLPLPFATSYKLSKLLILVEKHSKFYQAELQKIINEYTDLEKSTNDHLIIKEGMATECQNKINSLDNLEVDSPSFGFEIEEFQTLNLNISDTNLILPFINEEDAD